MRIPVLIDEIEQVEYLYNLYSQFDVNTPEWKYGLNSLTKMIVDEELDLVIR